MLVGLLRTMRPHQWVKNLFVLAPLVFAKELFDLRVALQSGVALVLFCLASSTVYVLNDLTDVESDRQHPVKRFRPIASGQVSLPLARNAALAMAVTALVGGLLLSLGFLATILGYLLLNLAYSARLKHMAYVDVLCIAGGFELRVVGGAFAAEVPPSGYLLVVMLLLATFLGFGKRMHELRTAEGHHQRKSLRAYNESTLSVLLNATAFITVATYAVYTLDPATREFFGTDFLVLSTAFTLFGVLRFLHLVRNRPHAESPTEEMLRDPPFLVNLALWAIAVLAIIYTT